VFAWKCLEIITEEYSVTWPMENNMTQGTGENMNRYSSVKCQLIKSLHATQPAGIFYWEF